MVEWMLHSKHARLGSFVKLVIYQLSDWFIVFWVLFAGLRVESYGVCTVLCCFRTVSLGVCSMAACFVLIVLYLLWSLLNKIFAFIPKKKKGLTETKTIEIENAMITIILASNFLACPTIAIKKGVRIYIKTFNSTLMKLYSSCDGSDFFPPFFFLPQISNDATYFLLLTVCASVI